MNDYRDPSDQQIKYRIYEALDMEIDELGNGRYFADFEAINGQQVQFSAMTLTTTDILTINVTDIKNCLPKKCFQEFESNLS